MKTQNKRLEEAIEQLKAYIETYKEDPRVQELPYHNVSHWYEVAENAYKLGKASGLRETECLLLKSAGYVHDIGHIAGNEGHEYRSARIALEVLPELGFTRAESAIVAGYAYATGYHREPELLTQKIMRDADIMNAGRDDFFEQNEALRKEWGARKGKDWLRRSYSFVKNEFYTTAAQKLYGKKRRENAQKLERMIEDC